MNNMDDAAQHTPGPWMAAARPSSVAGLPVVAQPSGRSIASVTFFHLGEAFANHDRESQANARLIAAAPDLLAALETVHDYASDVARGDMICPGYSGDLRAMATEDLARIKAAIAKARGHG